MIIVIDSLSDMDEHELAARSIADSMSDSRMNHGQRLKAKTRRELIKSDRTLLRFETFPRLEPSSGETFPINQLCVGSSSSLSPSSYCVITRAVDGNIKDGWKHEKSLWPWLTMKW
jgi:hypothetical protein